MVRQERLQGLRHLALVAAALARLEGDLLGHVPRPAGGRVDRDDANRAAEPPSDQDWALGIGFRRLAPGAAEIVQHQVDVPLRVSDTIEGEPVITQLRRLSLCGMMTARGEMSRGEKAKKQSARSRSQDRRRVAGGQDYEVRYESKKTGRSKAAVKKAVKKVGNSRKKVQRRLAR